jgi:hypothetical protein
MISIEEFEELSGLDLDVAASRWREVCDEGFAEYFTANWLRLDVHGLKNGCMSAMLNPT